MCLTSLPFILALSSLNLISYALPLKSQTSPKQPTIQRRVAYSVVAVDGGSDVTASAAPVIHILTLTQTSDKAKTVTAPASSTPPSIETIIVTSFVTGMEPEKTIFISVTQDVTTSTSRTATPSYSGIDSATAPTTSSIAPYPTYTFTSVSIGNRLHTFSTSKLITPSSLLRSSASTVSNPLTSSNRASEATLLPEAKHPEAVGPEVAVSTSSTPRTPPPTITISGTPPTSSTKTYDDGRWHTSYPFWNATLTVLSSASTTAVGTGKALNPWSKG